MRCDLAMFAFRTIRVARLGPLALAALGQLVICPPLLVLSHMLEAGFPYLVLLLARRRMKRRGCGPGTGTGKQTLL